MKDLIAYCGLDCGTCDARLATVNGDETLRRKTAELWSELNRTEITPEMIACTGCRIEGVKTPFCDSICPIRQCAMSRKVTTCGDCGEMASCEKLEAILRNNPQARRNLSGYAYVTLRERPDLADEAAEWFHARWGVPKESYLACMEAYLNGETEYGWYLCLDGDRIVGGAGVIENDFHDRKDLTPNVCAVYTEEDCRGQGIAGRILDMAVEDMRSRGVSPLYLLTDLTGFYEQYGWEFFCMAQGDGEKSPSRMYIHR